MSAGCAEVSAARSVVAATFRLHARYLAGAGRKSLTDRGSIFLQGFVGRLAHSLIGVPKGTLQSGDGFRGRCRDLSESPGALCSDYELLVFQGLDK